MSPMPSAIEGHEHREEIVEEIRRGESNRAIARRFEVSEGAIRRWKQVHGSDAGKVERMSEIEEFLKAKAALDKLRREHREIGERRLAVARSEDREKILDIVVRREALPVLLEAAEDALLQATISAASNLHPRLERQVQVVYAELQAASSRAKNVWHWFSNPQHLNDLRQAARTAVEARDHAYRLWRLAEIELSERNEARAAEAALPTRQSDRQKEIGELSASLPDLAVEESRPAKLLRNALALMHREIAAQNEAARQGRGVFTGDGREIHPRELQIHGDKEV